MLTQRDFAIHREKLLQKLRPNSVVILPAAELATRNRDMKFPFRQNSDFYYLTGFDEPSAVLVLSHDKYILFNQPYDLKKRPLTGELLGQEGAIKELGANEAYDIALLETKLPQMLMQYDSVYHSEYIVTSFDNAFKNVKAALQSPMNRGLASNKLFQNVLPIIHALRQIKEEKEIASIRYAIQITGNGFMRAMKRCQPGISEGQLVAEYMHEFLNHDMPYTSYPPIVGSGKNSSILHYDENNKKIENGEVVLIDIGGEYNYYAADITRTIPANGKFSPEQRAIYELVLAAQEAGIKAAKPGVTWLLLNTIVAEVITKGLVELGLLHGELPTLMQTKAYETFYMHPSGHWLGLDVHDQGKYDQIRSENTFPFQAGMTLTMEPGVYISDSITGVEARWVNIGVRIEDDLLITEDGCEVMSRGIPKSVEDIERIMALGGESKHELSDKQSYRMIANRLQISPQVGVSIGIEDEGSVNETEITNLNVTQHYPQNSIGSRRLSK